MAQKKGRLRCISDKELLHDQTLLNSLKRRGDPRLPEDRLLQALEQAVVRGTLLRAELHLFSSQRGEMEKMIWYFFHTARSRKVVQELEGGQLIPASVFPGVHVSEEEVEEEAEQLEPAQHAAIGARGYVDSRDTFSDVRVQIERPNIFVLYEQNIGLLSPLLADQLIEAEKHYPFDWIQDAFREAVQRNKRNWSYISAILRRWETEGRQ